MCENKKRVLFVANVTKEHILKFHIPTIKEFKNNGWVVDVISSGNEKVPFCDNQYNALWKRSPFNFSLFKGIAQLKKLLESKHYDVIFCHTPVGGLVGRIAAKKARKHGTKVIYCVHGYHFYKGSSFVSHMIFYSAEKWLSKYTDSIFLVNKEDYDLTKNKFRRCKDVRLVPEVGVDFGRIDVENPIEKRLEYRNKFSLSNNVHSLVYVAELIKNKNQKMLIDCADELLKRHYDIRLFLVGPNHYGNVLQKYVAKKKIESFVFFLGWRDDVGELLNMSDICVASSIREGFGLNIVEAMYCGLPVVATNNRGHSTIIVDGINGALVNINDYRSMANKVEALIVKGPTYALPSKEELSKYNSVNVAKTIYSVIKEVCNG